MAQKTEAKTTNEKPVKIPFPFEKALAGLLAINRPKKGQKSKKIKNKKNPVIRLGFFLDSIPRFAR